MAAYDNLTEYWQKVHENTVYVNGVSAKDQALPSNGATVTKSLELLNGASYAYAVYKDGKYYWATENAEGALPIWMFKINVKDLSESRDTFRNC